MKTICRISGKIVFLCWLMLLYLIWDLCRYGGIRRHLLWLIPCAWIFLISLVLWLVSRQSVKKDQSRSRAEKLIFLAEVVIGFLAAVFFGGHTVYQAVSGQSALAGKLDELKRERSVPLEHDNFFEDGAEGILEDLRNALELPEELYISNQFQLTFDEEGTIRTIYAFLYGEDEQGETRTFLIDYDADESGSMSVRLDGQADASYADEMRLDPMFRILEEADRESPCENLVQAWAETWEDKTYGILYMGRRSFDSYDGLIFLSGDADGDGQETSDRQVSQLLPGGEIVGYEVSLYLPDNDEVTPVRYIMEPEYRSPEELQEEQRQEQEETAKQSDTWTVDRTDGSMYFFYSDHLGWRLSVADAAAGSRFYQLEKTEDGGVTWETENQDPFGGQIGVAEGLTFFDENFGIAGLTNASESSSRLYVTRDGGATYAELAFPYDSVTELPESAATYGYTAADYDYLCMPEKEGSLLTVRAVSAAGEAEGLLFQSADDGVTWTWAGIR